MWQKLQFITLADKPVCSLDGMIVLITKADVMIKKKNLTSTKITCSLFIQIIFALILRNPTGGPVPLDQDQTSA